MSSEKRKFTQEKSEHSVKKMKTLPCTESEFLKSKIKIGDSSVVFIGYVDTIMGVQTFPNKSGEKSFDVFKFIVNNGDGITVQCNVYEKQISIFENKIVPDEKILLENAVACNTRYFTKSNVPFELILKHHSKITKLGQKPKCLPKACTLDDLKYSKGLIKIEGYLLNEFVLKSPMVKNEYFGVVTDRNFKLEVMLYSCDTPKFSQRTKLELIGDLQEAEGSFCLHIKDSEMINEIEGDVLPWEMLYKNYETVSNKD